MGIKIDLTKRVGQLKEMLMENVVQSRNKNFLLAKYAQFKVGLTVKMLTVLGVSPKEIKLLQTKALKVARVENIKLMGENTYNIELMELVHGKSKVNQKSMDMLVELEWQLRGQMALLGLPDYWSKSRMIEEKLRQLNKIREEFVAEKHALNYHYEFLAQEMQS